MKVAIIFPNLHGMPQTLDLGIAYLATYIQEKTKHEVKVIDVTFHTRNWEKHVQSQINEFQPDVIGFSVFSVLWGHCRTIITDIKTYYPQAPIIVGGYQAIMCAEETILAPEVDVICTGEGELTLTDYLDALETGRALETVKGIWFKDSEGRVKKNERRPAIPKLDDLPFPNWDVFEDIEKYLFFLGRLYVLGTRGCPYRCSFCAETALEDKDIYSGGRWRERDPIQYVDEIEYQYKKYKNRGMIGAHFFDTVFSVNEEWLKTWSAEYRKRGLDKALQFTVFARPDLHNLSDRKIRILSDSGCVQVRMGIEAGDSEKRLKELNKPGCKNEVVLGRINKLNEHNILCKTYSIIGLPSDDKKSIWETIKFTDNSLVQTKFVLSYTPIPGTPLAATVMKMNREAPSQKYSFHFSGGVANKHYGPHYIHLMLLWCYIYFGIKQAWFSFKSSPMVFLKIVPSRIFMGFVWGNPILLTTLYSLIHASYWKGWKKEQKRYFTKKNYQPLLEGSVQNG